MFSDRKIRWDRIHRYVCLILALAAQQFACQSVDRGEPLFSRPDIEGENIFITDQAGQRWDITHAVRTYGFDPARFAHGLGKGAIKALFQPRFLAEGEPGYPPDDATQLVLGTTAGDSARAYPIYEFSFHEVANESWRGAHMAPAY